MFDDYWFTVVAQMVNFLVLVWLLKRFLYKPVLQAIDEREKRIAAQLQEAERRQAEAQQERAEFQRNNELLEQQRGDLLKKAADDANAERRRLLDEVRSEAESMRSKRQEALRDELGNLRRQTVERLQNEVFAVAKKTLADLAAANLEERIAEVFIGRLRQLGSDDKTRLTTNHNGKLHPARVRSAFELSPAQRAAVEGAVHETFADSVQVQFETAPELIAGIELTMNGYKLAWSIGDYLAALEKSATADKEGGDHVP